MAASTTWGALFDWDGVVIDSSVAHCQSWELLAAEEGLPLPADHFARSFGRRNADLIPNILGWSQQPAEIQRLGDRKEALYRDIIRAEGIDPLPGVMDLIRWLCARGVPCAVGTSTPRANVETILDLLGLSDAFVAIVASEDVSEGKPNPEVFTTGAARIGREPSRCVVFEDSLHGLEAGRLGGMFTVAVATTHPLAELQGHRWVDRAVHRLSDLDFAALEAAVLAR